MYSQVSLEKLYSSLGSHKPQWLIKVLRWPAVKKLFNFAKVIVFPNLIDQKELLLLLSSNTLLTIHGITEKCRTHKISINNKPQASRPLIQSSPNVLFILNSYPWLTSSIFFVYQILNEPNYSTGSYHMNSADGRTGLLKNNFHTKMLFKLIAATAGLITSQHYL